MANEVKIPSLATALQAIGQAHVYIGDPFVTQTWTVLGQKNGAIEVAYAETWNQLLAEDITGPMVHDEFMMGQNLTATVPIILRGRRNDGVEDHADRDEGHRLVESAEANRYRDRDHPGHRGRRRTLLRHGHLVPASGERGSCSLRGRGGTEARGLVLAGAARLRRAPVRRWWGRPQARRAGDDPGEVRDSGRRAEGMKLGYIGDPTTAVPPITGFMFTAPT